LSELESLQKQVEEIEARLQRFGTERTRVSTSLSERQLLRKQAQAVLARGDQIEKAAAELDSVRRDLESITRKQREYLPLERAREAAVRTLAAEQARLEGEVAQRERRLAEVRQVASQLGALQAQLRRVQTEISALAKVEAQHAELQAIVGESRERAAEKRTTNLHLKDQMVDLRSRLTELESVSTCPTCKRPMDERHKSRLHAEYMKEGTRLRDDFRTNEAACRELDTSISGNAALLAQAAKALTGREAVQRRFAQAENAVSQAEEASRQTTILEKELLERQQLLRAGGFAAPARQELAGVEKKIAALGYDEKRHAQLHARATELAGMDRERQLLEQARLSAEHLDSQISEFQESLKRLAEECASDGQRLTQLRLETRGLPGERQRLAELSGEAAEARRSRDETRDQCLFAQSRLDNCAFLERKQRESLAKQDGLRREQSVFGDLAYAFGRRGVQAMIIETAIPEIEDEANRILGRMTDGRMHVKFETQRDVRSGVGTVETLDIKISDELGTRSYEMFSGGESFRVNFSIRIALSRLLAHRAGTRLQTLVVDEGFGSQDQDGRDRIVEAIQAIEAEFEKILIITHLEDLRERFPVRIEVFKTPKGSTYVLR
jgi:exonuclease SbcC